MVKTLEIASFFDEGVLKDPQTVFYNQMEWKEKVATSEQLENDYLYCKNAGDKFIKSPTFANFALRAVVGHSNEGHCSFRGTRYPNTTLNDIFTSDVVGGEKSLETLLEQNKSILRSVAQIIYEAATTDQPALSLEEHVDILGEPLWSVVEPLAFLKGFAFGGMFDNYNLRKIAEYKYGINLGGGYCFKTDMDILSSLGIDISELARADFSSYDFLNGIPAPQRREIFERVGLIERLPEIDFSEILSVDDFFESCSQITGPRFSYEYIREAKGDGVSDDTAVSIAPFLDFCFKNNSPLHYKSLKAGAEMADFVDTICKFAPYYTANGLDEDFAGLANHLFLKRVREDKYYAERMGINKGILEKRLAKEGDEFALIPKDELVDFIALSKNPYKEPIHSSARYFTLTVPTVNKVSYVREQQTALMLSILAKHGIIRDKSAIPKISLDYEIGFHRYPATNFYERLRDLSEIVMKGCYASGINDFWEEENRKRKDALIIAKEA